MFEKLKDFYALFTAGQSVENAIRLKKTQIYGGAFAGFLGALVVLAKVFGYDLPITDEQLVQLGGACATLFGMYNAGATVASTDKLGLPSKQKQIASSDSTDQSEVPAVSAPPTPTAVQSKPVAVSREDAVGLDDSP